MSVPMSLRTPSMEERYQKAKLHHLVQPLSTITPIRCWKHWKLIPNAYPYDAVFSKHHMLLPIRLFGQREEMNLNELVELHLIQQEIMADYDCFIENTPNKQSNRTHFHIHSASYYAERP
jgi:hypothetical protein